MPRTLAYNNGRERTQSRIRCHWHDRTTAIRLYSNSFLSRFIQCKSKDQNIPDNQIQSSGSNFFSMFHAGLSIDSARLIIAKQGWFDTNGYSLEPAKISFQFGPVILQGIKPAFLCLLKFKAGKLVNIQLVEISSLYAPENTNRIHDATDYQNLVKMTESAFGTPKGSFRHVDTTRSMRTQFDTIYSSIWSDKDKFIMINFEVRKGILFNANFENTLGLGKPH